MGRIEDALELLETPVLEGELAHDCKKENAKNMVLAFLGRQALRSLEANGPMVEAIEKELWELDALADESDGNMFGTISTTSVRHYTKSIRTALRAGKGGEE